MTDAEEQCRKELTRAQDGREWDEHNLVLHELVYVSSLQHDVENPC